MGHTMTLCAHLSPLSLCLTGAKDWKEPDSLITNHHTFLKYNFHFPQTPYCSLHLKWPFPKCSFTGCLVPKLQLLFSFCTLVLHLLCLPSSLSAVVYLLFPPSYNTIPGKGSGQLRGWSPTTSLPPSLPLRVCSSLFSQVHPVFQHDLQPSCALFL